MAKGGREGGRGRGQGKTINHAGEEGGGGEGREARWQPAKGGEARGGRVSLEGKKRRQWTTTTTTTTLEEKGWRLGEEKTASPVL